jgi:hypothetical protein
MATPRPGMTPQTPDPKLPPADDPARGPQAPWPAPEATTGREMEPPKGPQPGQKGKQGGAA